MTTLHSPLRAKCWAVILAAGKRSFERNSVPIPYHSLAGANVVQWATAPFLKHPSIEAVVIVVAQSDVRWQGNGPTSDLKPIWVTQGGEHRCHSSFSGLVKLQPKAEPDDWVIVHDATRPCLELNDLDRLITRLAGDDVGGVMAVPIEDNPKTEDEPGIIKNARRKQRFWGAQTPQMFRFGKLKSAFAQAANAGVLPDDESHAMEIAGHRCRIVEGNCANIKVTCSQHLTLADAVLRSREPDLIPNINED